jgi:hypothetical protein
MSTGALSHPLLRRLIIGGDLIAVSLILGLGGGLTLGAAALGGAPPWAGALGGLTLGLAVVGVRVSRALYRRLLQEVVDRFAGHDPGPSPVPWISDAVWRSKNGFDPALDAPNELLAEVHAGSPRFGAPTGGGVQQAVLRPVSEDERELVAAPSQVSLSAADAAASQAQVEARRASLSGPAAELVERLHSTPGRSIVVAPRWPVCCRQLTVLTSVVPSARGGSVFLNETILSDLHAPPGAHTYRCAACGRAWSTDPTW